tara:strand:+ start:4439 stop:4744 length:306 start_codon:yes stop_codon:yes gene_type:complete
MNNQTITQIKDLLDTMSITPKITNDGPVGTTLQIVTKPELNSTQKLIMLYLTFNSNMDATPQRELVYALGLTNKCVRENLTALIEKSYVKRGTKAFTWDPM